MIFDISTPDAAFKFIQDFFNITGSGFIDEYIIECNNDFDSFWNKRLDYIDSTNIDHLKYKALHVTSNWDDCLEIKMQGIKNLQAVLSEQTTLRNLLLEYGVKFDIENKALVIGEKVIDIDYDKFRGRFRLTSEEERIREVARKIYFDPQVNAFFSIDDIARYGTDIHCRPEFLMNLSSLIPRIKEVEKIWCTKSKGYIVTFLADFDQFAWYSFYDYEDNYWEDMESRLILKKWLISNAVSRSFERGGSEIIAYMGSGVTITPEQIIDYTAL
ncbi:hypothetical protein MFMK1_000811 [Metallumcola ferriviriculae]|uniref:Uncharacterized protein n=1 Tax=Metallumcola ferriviriculae TaxID=3039180 RepID=A0AAU0ULE0_9FIRM|nr:hypothetical protein MFMK1_000811 [Desulfitibacteraceae bacterium MK1]